MTADSSRKEREAALPRLARLAGAVACLAVVAFAAAERSAAASDNATSRPCVLEDSWPPASSFQIAAGKGAGLGSGGKPPVRGSSAELYGGSSADRYGGSSADKGGVVGPRGDRQGGVGSAGYGRGAGNKGGGNTGGGDKRNEEKGEEEDQQEDD